MRSGIGLPLLLVLTLGGDGCVTTNGAEKDLDGRVAASTQTNGGGDVGEKTKEPEKPSPKFYKATSPPVKEISYLERQLFSRRAEVLLFQRFAFGTLWKYEEGKPSEYHFFSIEYKDTLDGHELKIHYVTNRNGKNLVAEFHDIAPNGQLGFASLDNGTEDWTYNFYAKTVTKKVGDKPREEGYMTQVQGDAAHETYTGALQVIRRWFDLMILPKLPMKHIPKTPHIPPGARPT